MSKAQVRSSLIGLMALLLGPAIAPTARAGFTQFGGHYYGLTSGPLSWTDAEAQAVALGGHLAAITSAAEQDFLFSVFPQNQDLWIGLTDRAVEGTFTWTTGESLSYTNWFPGEPNSLGGDEDYVNLNANTFKWNDNVDGFQLQGIIELNANPVPEPSGLILLGLGAVGLIRHARRKASEATGSRRAHAGSRPG